MPSKQVHFRLFSGRGKSRIIFLSNGECVFVLREDEEPTSDEERTAPSVGAIMADEVESPWDRQQWPSYTS